MLNIVKQDYFNLYILPYEKGFFRLIEKGGEMFLLKYEGFDLNSKFEEILNCGAKEENFQDVYMMNHSIKYVKYNDKINGILIVMDTESKICLCLLNFNMEIEANLTIFKSQNSSSKICIDSISKYHDLLQINLILVESSLHDKINTIVSNV